MVQEYIEKCYWPAAQRYDALAAENLAKAQQLAEWRRGVARNWGQIRIEQVEAHGADPMHVGAQLQVKARVNLGNLAPHDVQVQLFHGLVDSLGEIPHPHTVVMSPNGTHEGSSWTFHGVIPCRTSGQHGYAVRILPKHPDLANPFEPGLVCWG